MRTIAVSAAAATLLSLVLSVQASAQSPEERAHIDWETARLALQQGQPDVALAKLEKVMEVLGPLPDLLYLAAEAAFQAGDTVRASEYIKRTYAAADEHFRSGDQYQNLIALSAKLELASSTKPSPNSADALEVGTCYDTFMPTRIGSSFTKQTVTSQGTLRSTGKIIEGPASTITVESTTEWTSRSAQGATPKAIQRVNRFRCAKGGLVFLMDGREIVSGVDAPWDLRVGVTWKAERRIDGGTTFTIPGRVTRQEAVTVLGSQRQAFVLESTSSDSTTTSWVVPGLGFVRQETSGKYPSRMDLTAASVPDE